MIDLNDLKMEFKLGSFNNGYPTDRVSEGVTESILGILRIQKFKFHPFYKLSLKSKKISQILIIIIVKL